jgi:hypothetical protein
LASHLAEWLLRVIFAQVHQHVMSGAKLTFVKGTGDGHASVAEFRQERGKHDSIGNRPQKRKFAGRWYAAAAADNLAT